MASEHTGGTLSEAREYLLAFSTVLVLVAGGFLVSSLLVSIVLRPPLRGPVDYTVSTVLQNAGFVAVVLAYVWYAGLPDLLAVRWPSLSEPRRSLSDLGWVLAGLLALVVASQVVAIALQGVGFTPGTNRVVSAVRADPTLGLYLLVLSFLATGPGEELLFRGGVQGTFRRVFSAVPAVVLSSAFFGLAHVTATVAATGTNGVWGYVVTTFLLGLILGGLYEYTDNLLVPILIHGAYNALTFAQLYAHETLAFGLGHWVF